MVEVKYDKYLVEKIGRLDLRYYLIKVHNRYYVIDYFNPRDFRNFLPKKVYEWKIYDVTDNYQDYVSMPLVWRLPPYIEKFMIGMVFLYLFSGLILPKQIRLQILGYDPRILQNWNWVLFGILIGYLLLVLLLAVMRPNRKELGNYPTYLLRQIPKKNKKELRFIPLSIRWLFTMFILLSMFLFMGIVSRTYVGLFVFSIYGTYSSIVPQLANFPLSTGNSEYYILK